MEKWHRASRLKDERSQRRTPSKREALVRIESTWAVQRRSDDMVMPKCLSLVTCDNGTSLRVIVNCHGSDPIHKYNVQI